MHRAAPSTRPGWRRATTLARRTVLGCLLAGPLLLQLPAGAAPPELTSFEIDRDDGVLISYALNFELSRSVEDALNKGVPLYFVAEAEVFRDRWYWRDRRIARATRTWRIVYQPLTVSWRVTFGGLTQSYPSSAEAFAAVRRASRWKVADASQIDPDETHYLEFSFRLDTSLLPRPMQIGIGGQPDWNLVVERTQRFR